jgi:uncharacterized protein (DUF1015 family)
MANIKPFRAYRPRPELAEKIASPPYDVLTSSEARVMAEGNPLSFLHVVKPEIDLPENTDLYADEVYAKGAENLRRLITENALVQEEQPAFYLYEQQMGDHVQIGVVAGASVDEYEQDLIKKHELTRRKKEDDRTRHVESLNANTGPVFLTYKASKEIDGIVIDLKNTQPTYTFTAPDGIRHTIWVVDRPGDVARMHEAFHEVDVLYVADGHHRSAAGTRVRGLKMTANPQHTGLEPYNFFLSVIFPHDQMKILDYNRVVRDLGGLSVPEFLDRVSVDFTYEIGSKEKPKRPQTYAMLLQDTWYKLEARPGSFPVGDPVNSLDVAILQNNLLGPILGITDPRSDERIDFVGGIRGLDELQKRVSQGWAVAFALYPTSIEQLMAVADAGRTMPPKSTWFEPKLRSGLIIRPLDD